MALILCPECGKEISDKAVSCPNCGSPINNSANQKFCQHCGEKIDKECVVCPKCGKQVGELSGSDKNIIINNSSSASAAASSSASSSVRGAAVYGIPKNKWVSLLLHELFSCNYSKKICPIFTPNKFARAFTLLIAT